MSSIDRQTTPNKGVVYEMAAAQTGTPNMGIGGGAIGYVEIPSGWDGGLAWTWHAVIEVAGALVERPITDTAGVAVSSTVLAATANEIPPAAMGFRIIVAKFDVTTLAQTIRLFTKG